MGFNSAFKGLNWSVDQDLDVRRIVARFVAGTRQFILSKM